MATKFVLDGAEVQHLLVGETGPVVRYLMARGLIVQEAAKRQVGVDTGDLRDSIVKRFAMEGGQPAVWVGVPTGSRASGYALLHHEGTAPHEIWPKKPGGVLAFTPRGSDTVVFASMVHHPGTKPNRYLTDNLPLAVGEA